jgi:hypothetical protein
VEPRVLDDPAAFLFEQVDGEDQSARNVRPHVVDELRLDQKSRSVRRQLARRRRLEPAHHVVGIVVSALAEHRPQ